MLLTLLALAAPLPALALNSDGTEPVAATPAPAALEVSTALDSCGIVDTQVVCKLSVTFGEVPGATSYTATVTRADGSVVDYGSVGAGGASLWVPYVGAGNYGVRVSAYGAPPKAKDGDKDKRGNLITSDAAEAEPVEDDKAGNQNADERDHPGARFGQGQGQGANATATNDAGADPNPAAEATVEQCEAVGQTATPPIPEPPPLPEPPPEDRDPNNPDEDADGILDEQEKTEYDEAVAAQAEAEALAEEAQSPEQVTCPARRSGPGSTGADYRK